MLISPTTITFVCLGMDSWRIYSQTETVKSVIPWILLPEHGCGTCFLPLMRCCCNLSSVIENVLVGHEPAPSLVPQGVVCVYRVKQSVAARGYLVHMISVRRKDTDCKMPFKTVVIRANTSR